MNVSKHRSTSWSKPNIKNLIARKHVDWSVFKWGSTISLELVKSQLVCKFPR
jgi:hypothetical protein